MRKEVIKFARIVESEDSFYLLRVDFNKETNNYDLIIERCIDDFDAIVGVSIPYNDYEDAIKAMNNPLDVFFQIFVQNISKKTFNSNSN